MMTYYDYTKGGISNRKKVIAVFNGDINDMTEVFVSELYSLFSDESFEPADETAIFKVLKYNVIRRLNQELKSEPLTRTIVVTNKNDDDEEYEIIPAQLIYNPFDDVPESGYSGANKELLNVIRSVDIERLCRSNAETQINVANLIKKYYREVDSKYPSLDKMLEYCSTTFHLSNMVAKGNNLDYLLLLLMNEVENGVNDTARIKELSESLFECIYRAKIFTKGVRTLSPKTSDIVLFNVSFITLNCSVFPLNAKPAAISCPPKPSNNSEFASKTSYKFIPLTLLAEHLNC